MLITYNLILNIFKIIFLMIIKGRVNGNDGITWDANDGNANC